MCYRVSRDFDEVDVKVNIELKVDRVLSEFGRKYNVAITNDMPVIIPGSRVLDLYRWGLIPFWAKDIKIGSMNANARAESVDTKASFKESFKKRRCLVLASGFFEWDKEKQPYHITVKGRKILAFAGLYDIWKDSGKIINSCTIITCEPNEFIKKLHNRMPVILDPDDYETWLKTDDLDQAKKLLVPYKGELIGDQVTRKMNSVKYQEKDSIEKLGS